MSKPKLQWYNIMMKISLDIGFGIKADSLTDAIAKAEAMKINDIVDFQVNGWDHNDSEQPIVTGVFRS